MPRKTIKTAIPAPADVLLLSIPQAARRLGICRSSVYSLIQSGALPTLKSGRRTLIEAAALPAMIARATGATP